MAVKTRAQLIADITAEITTNGNREITGEDLRLILLDMLDSFYNIPDDAINGTRVVIEPENFTSPTEYTNAILTTMTAEIDFALFANDGQGTKIRLNEGYTYTPGSGIITIPSGVGSYYLIIFKPN